MNPAGPTPPPAVPPVTPAGALTPDPTLPNPTAPPPPRPSRKKTFIIAGSIAAAVLLVAGGVTWYMLDQNAQRKQAQVSAVSSVVTSFFTNARQGSLASVDALLLPNLDKEKVSHIETLSKQIGRDCAVNNASVKVRSDTPQTAGAQAVCLWASLTCICNPLMKIAEKSGLIDIQLAKNNLLTPHKATYTIFSTSLTFIQ